MIKRIPEFFEGENNRLSMMRLTVFLSFFPATAVLIYIKNTESLAVYLGAYVGGVVSSKGVDVFGRRRGKNAVSTKSTEKP